MATASAMATPTAPAGGQGGAGQAQQYPGAAQAGQRLEAGEGVHGQPGGGQQCRQDGQRAGEGRDGQTPNRGQAGQGGADGQQRQSQESAAAAGAGGQEHRRLAAQPLQGRGGPRFQQWQRRRRQGHHNAQQHAGDGEGRVDVDGGGGHGALHRRGDGGAHRGQRGARRQAAAQHPRHPSGQPDERRLHQHGPGDLAAPGAQGAQEGDDSAPLHHRGGEGGGYQHGAHQQGYAGEGGEVELQGAEHALAALGALARGGQGKRRGQQILADHPVPQLLQGDSRPGPQLQCVHVPVSAEKLLRRSDVHDDDVVPCAGQALRGHHARCDQLDGARAGGQQQPVSHLEGQALGQGAGHQHAVTA